MTKTEEVQMLRKDRLILMKELGRAKLALEASSAKIEALKHTLGTLITWLAGPLSVQNIGDLLAMLPDSVDLGAISGNARLDRSKRKAGEIR